MNIAIYTLGCKVNQYETAAMERELTRRGHVLTPFEGPADAYVVNTCSVTAVSDKKSRQMIRRARKRSPAAVVAVCGCYPQTHPQDMEGLSVDLVAGTGDRLHFVELLEQTWRDRRPVTALDDAFSRREFEILPPGGLEGRTRAMLKVEDGCVNFCSYCAIPYARGRVRSLPLEEAVRQTREIQARGYRELVLTGIELSSWGSLPDLIEAVCTAAPDCRVRLGSLEPRTITEEFCLRTARLPNLCPHFHLSLQSGCDSVLARMNRKYDCARYDQSVTLLREYFDRPAITTDLIVGFPGETEEEFRQTLDFIQQMWFSLVQLARGTMGVQELSGPVGIVSIITEVGTASESAASAARDIAYFAALIAINLAVMNMLPIPALDGGRIFFLLVDAAALLLFRRKVPEKWQAAVNAACFMLLMGMMALVTLHDVTKLIM